MRIKGIKKLIQLVEESKISELEVSWFGTRVRILKDRVQSNSRETVTAVSPSGDVSDVEKVEVPSQKGKKYIPIRSPMVGTFYRSPAPDAPPYVELNDLVK